MDLNKGTYYGLWWLPENFDQKISGTLTFDENGDAIFFTLDSFEKSNAKSFTESWGQYDLILGMATSMKDGKDYSLKLYSVYQIQKKEQVFSKSKFKVPTVIIGAINTEEVGDSFKSLMLFSSIWHRWVRNTSLKRKSLFNDSQTKFGYTYEYVQPDLVTLYKNEGDCIYVYYRASTSHTIEGITTLEEQAYLNFDLTKPRGLKEVIRLKTSLDRFFMILWESPHTFSNCEVGSKYGTDFTVYGNPPKPNNRFVDNYKFKNFVTDSQELITSWFSKNEEYNFLINTFFFAYNGYKLDVENKFLNIVFALELFHRKLFKDQEPLSAKNERMSQKVMEEVKSADTKSWLMSILNKGSNISFSKRLNELISSIDDGESLKFSDAIIDRIKKTRHYLVHLDEKHLENRLTPKELVDINDNLSKLMLKLLKKEIFEYKKA